MRKILCLYSLLLIVPLCVFGQTRQISGTVKDSRQNSIPFATVAQKGTSNSIAADDQGNFTISVTGNNVVLVISSSGYSEKEIAVGSSSRYDVTLEEAGNLGEVVVTALGIKKERKALGYSVTDLSATELMKNKNTN